MADEDGIFTQGDGTISGIWLYAASRMEPQPSLEVNPEWIRTVFFEFIPSKAGNVVFRIDVDGKKAGEIFGTTIDEKQVGQKLPFAFWYPARARKKGVHTVTILVGYHRKKKWFIFETQEQVYTREFTFPVTILREEEN